VGIIIVRDWALGPEEFVVVCALMLFALAGGWHRDQRN